MADMNVLKKNHEIATKSVNDCITLCNNAIKGGNLQGYHTAMSKLKEAIRSLNSVERKIAYCELAGKEQPMLEAVKKFTIDITKVNESKSNGTVVAVVKTTSASRIDLSDFCEYAELPTEWTYDCAELLALMTLHEMDVLSMSDYQFEKAIEDGTYFFIRQARLKKNGETPDSNTRITKLIQKIVDAVVFVDNGMGKNVYKCTKNDIEFIKSAASRLDTKAKCSISMMNNRQFQTVMMSVFAHVLGEAYRVNYSVKGEKGVKNSFTETLSEYIEIDGVTEPDAQPDADTTQTDAESVESVDIAESVEVSSETVAVAA